jgi:Fic family protein
MLFTAPALTVQENQVVEKIDQLRSTIAYATSQRVRWVGLLRRTSYARAIRGSNSIEGYNVTEEDAMAAAQGEAPFQAEAQGQTWQAVQGYRNAMTYVLNLAADPHFQYEESLVRSLHFMLMQYDLTKNPGRWRPGPIYVRNDATGATVYEGPPAEDVPALMSELALSLSSAVVESAIPVMVKAAMAHLNLVMIHPFSDGNGRMARCLQTLMILREKILHPEFCSIEEYLGRNTDAYYKVLEEVGQGQWNPQNSARPWIRFCLRAHYEQAMRIQRRQKMYGKLLNEIEEEAKRRQLHERMVMPLAEAALGFRLRNSRYQALADVSDNLASRDLKLLVEAQLLVPKGENRGRIYEASDSLKALPKRFKEDGPIPDPFASTGQGELF